MLHQFVDMEYEISGSTNYSVIMWYFIKRIFQFGMSLNEVGVGRGISENNGLRFSRSERNENLLFDAKVWMIHVFPLNSFRHGESDFAGCSLTDHVDDFLAERPK